MQINQQYEHEHSKIAKMSEENEASALTLRDIIQYNTSMLCCAYTATGDENSAERPGRRRHAAEASVGSGDAGRRAQIQIHRERIRKGRM